MEQCRRDMVVSPFQVAAGYEQTGLRRWDKPADRLGNDCRTFSEGRLAYMIFIPGFFCIVNHLLPVRRPWAGSERNFLAG